MPGPVWMGTIALVAGLGAIAAGCLALWRAPRAHLRRVLAAVTGQGSAAGQEVSFRDRVVRPLLAAWAGRLALMTPGAVRTGLGLSLERAGRPAAKADVVLLTRILVALGGLLAGAALGAVTGLGATFVALMALFGTVTASLVPTVELTHAVEARQRAIGRALPDTLDLLVTTVEAGLGFEAALGRVAEGRTDPLGQEIRLALLRMRLGQGRGQSLREMGRRTGVEDVARFAAAVAQAEELGTSVGGVLRAQSQLLRRLRLLRSEEAAAKVPIKMLFPMVIFILPGLFLLVLGPSILHALQLGVL